MWISIDERLPEPFVEVWAFNPKKIHHAGTAFWVDRNDFEAGEYWSYRGVSGGTKEMISDLRPTHWMPLPEPPET